MDQTMKPSAGENPKTTHKTACVVRSPVGIESDWPRDHHTRDSEAESNYCYGFVCWFSLQDYGLQSSSGEELQSLS